MSLGLTEIGDDTVITALDTATGATNLGTIGPAGFYANTAIRLTANGGNFAGGERVQFSRCRNEAPFYFAEAACVMSVDQFR